MVQTSPFDLVVIAASADGISAIRTILSALPDDWPVPVAVVQHRSAQLPNYLPEVLGQRTRLRVKLAEPGEAPRAGTVYLASPDRHLFLAPDRTFASRDGSRIRHVRSSANPLLESAADVLGGRVIAVVLTGSGCDATDGVQAVRARGGTVIAQDPSTTAFSGMPSSAIRTGVVTHVRALGEIAPLLRELVLDGNQSGVRQADPAAPQGRMTGDRRVRPVSVGRNEWLRAELSRPQAYSGSVARVESRRTLVSLLFFAGERVYKLKQAVDLGYIDATTLERRRAFCEDEVRLNAPLAPGIHLGVVPIRRGADGHLVVGGDAGEIVEYAVEMVRLPEERMLARLLEHGVIDNEQMNALAELLCAFHRSAATGEGVDEYGTPAGIEVNVEENFTQLAPFVRSPERPAGAGSAVLSAAQHAFLHERARGFLQRQRELLERRVAERRIREGHGDLHAGNVCLLPAGFVQ